MRKISIISLITALMMLILCACGAPAETESAGEPSESVVTSTPKPTPPPKTIGAKMDSDTEVSLEVKNSTGEAITSWKVKLSGEEEYSDNMLDDDIFLQNGTRVLYIDPENDDANRLCDIEVEFEDIKATIHNFPLDDADYVELCKEGAVVYLIYESKTSKQEINTLEEEQAIVDAAEAAEAAKNSSSSGSGSYSGGGSSYSGSSSGSSGSSGYSAPVSGGDSGSSGGGDDGCIGDDGLLY